MADSLTIVQKLYEEGYLTYPRTNSEYLATNEKDKIKKIISNIKNIGYPVVFKDKKTIFDDSKIESHSALTPTYKIPKKEHLSEREMQVYQTVFRRFVAVFCDEDCLAQKTEMVIDVGGYEQFTLKGITIITKGFLKFDDSDKKDKILPNLSVGDEVEIFGRYQTADDLARMAGTIPYEVTCAVSKRVPRRYLEQGKLVERTLRILP